MRKFAKGNKAWGRCARSGDKILLHKMVRDGLYPNMLVSPKWYEPPYPDWDTRPMDDAISVRNPAPDYDEE